ncbi:MAG: hypothetical protein QW734_03695 [Candidatus Bathyarchaeia archaeon]
MHEIDVTKLEEEVNKKAKEWVKEEIERWINEITKLNKCEICKKDASVLIALCDECYKKWSQKKKSKNK